MKRLLLLLLAPVLTGCLGIEQRFAEARMEWGTALTTQATTQTEANDKLAADVQASATEMAAGLKTATEHLATVEEASEERSDTIGESLDALGNSVKETWKELEAGVKAELATVSAGAKGVASVLGFGPIVDMLATAATAFGATNIARNKGIIGTTRVQPRTGYPGPGDTVPPTS